MGERDRPSGPHRGRHRGQRRGSVSPSPSVWPTSGATVAVWDRDEAVAAEAVATLDSGGGKAVAFTVEQADAASVAEAARRTEADARPHRHLVNNAGISGPTMPVVDYPLDEWRRIVDIDLNGVFYCCKAVVPGMISRGYGRIVNVASIAGKEGNPNAAAYSAAKAGVIALTKSLGKELAAHDIAVNCVTPAAAQDQDLRPDQPAAHRLHAGAHPARPLPEGRGSGGDDRLARLGEENSFTTGAVFDLSGGRARPTEDRRLAVRCGSAMSGQATLGFTALQGVSAWPSGSKLFGLTSYFGKLDDDTSRRMRCPALNRIRRGERPDNDPVHEARVHGTGLFSTKSR